MNLTQRAKHLAHGVEVLLQLEVAVVAQTVQVHQAGARALDALADEAVGGAEVGLFIEDLAVARVHLLGDLVERIAPGPVGFRPGVELIDARFVGLLVLQQQIGESAVGGDHEDAVVDFLVRRADAEDVVQNRVRVGHRGAADLMDAVLCQHMVGTLVRRALLLLGLFVRHDGRCSLAWFGSAGPRGGGREGRCPGAPAVPLCGGQLSTSASSFSL